MDFIILKYLNDWAGQKEWLDSLIIFSAEYLGAWIMFSVLLFAILAAIRLPKILERYDRKKIIQTAVFSLFSALISRFILTEIIRFFYSKPRPFEVLELYQLVAHKTGGSFPSGHAAFFFALAAGVYFYPRAKDFAMKSYHKKLGALLFIGAFIIGAARVSAGIHWPSDVLAGAIIGIASAILTRRLIPPFQKFYKNYHRIKNPRQ